MTLSVTPKVHKALQSSVMQPVVAARIVTALNDIIYELYDDWADTSPGNVLSEHRTQIVKSHEITENPPAYLEMLYPAQPGDPLQTVAGYKIYSADPDQPTPIISGPFMRGPGYTTQECWQSFRITFGSPLIYSITGVKFRLSKTTRYTRYNLRAILYSTDPVKTKIAASLPINTADVPNSAADVEFTFADPVRIERGKVYVVSLLSGLIEASGADSQEPDRIGIETYVKQNLAPLETAGLDISGPNFISSKNIEFAIEILSKPYSYDGTNVNHRKMKFDFGSVPTGTGYIEANYEKPGDSRIQFRLYGSATGEFVEGVDQVDLGSIDTHTLADHGHDGAISHVHEGDQIKTPYRYYAIDILLSSPSLLWSAKVHRIGPAFVSNQRIFSTHPISTLGAITAITDIPSVPTKLDLKGYISQTQKFNLEIADIGGSVSEMGIEEHLKNTTVDLFIGSLSDGITTIAEMTPYASGKVTDFRVEHGKIILDIQDRSKDMDVKVPKPLSSGSEVPDIIDYSFPEPNHMVDVLDDLLFNKARIPRRYQDIDSFLQAKVLIGDKFITRRIINEETEVKDLVTGILEITGLFLVHTEDGKIKLVQWPRIGTSVTEWDDSDLLEPAEQLASFESSIVNQCVVKYNKGEDDFIGYFGVIDAQAQADFAPGSAIFFADRLIESEWIGGEDVGGSYLAHAVAHRIVRGSKEGVIRHSVQTSLAEFSVQVGDLVTLKTPVFLEKGRNTAIDGIQMMVISKSADFSEGTIDWEVAEALPTNHPPIVTVVLSTQAGVLDLTVIFDITAVDPDGDVVGAVELDPDYDGHIFRPTATGSPVTYTYTAAAFGGRTGVIAAVRATDEFGGFTIVPKKIRFFYAPEAIITVLQTDPTQPLNAELSGANSFPGSSDIVEYAWDLEYNGSFIADVIGQTIKISTHNASILIALKVTNADGLSDLAEFELTGKTFPPTNPTGLRISQVGNLLLFNWDANPDVDLWGYELRSKYEPTGIQTANWETANVVNEEILSNSYLMPVPPTGTYTFLLKAIDSTGNRSVGAAVTLIDVAEDGTRETLYAQDEGLVSPAWPGSTVNLIYKTEGSRWWLARTSIGDTINDLNATETINDLDPAVLISDLGGLLFGAGYYETDPIDLGEVVPSPRLFIGPSVVRDYPEDTYYEMYYSISSDNVTYTALVQVNAIIDIPACRYIKVRVVLYSEDQIHNIALDGLQILVDKLYTPGGSPLYTTAQRDALPPKNGRIIYNTTLNKFQGYENGTWVNLIGA